MQTRPAPASGLRVTSMRAAIAGLLAFLAFAAPPTHAALVTDGEIVSMDNYTVSDSRFSLPVSTAVKLPLTPRETPQSVASVDRLRLDLESLFSVNEVMQTITGVHVSFYDSQRPLYFARGFQITDFQVDGVPTYSGSTNQEYDTALYERVEVVRGANGLLSGAGTPSATVNLQRKRPGGEFDASFAATIGNWDYYRGEADLNAPLTSDGRFRSRFVVAAQTRGSFRDRYSDEKLAWLASVEGDVTDTTTINAGYQRQTNDPTSPLWGVIPRFAVDGSLAQLPRSINFSADWAEWDRDSGTAFATVDQRIGEDWTVHVGYARTEGDVFRLAVYATGFPDLATGAGTYLRAGVTDTEDTRDNVDVYITGRFPFLDREHDVMLGWNSNDLESTSFPRTSVASWRYDIPNLWAWTGDAPQPAIDRTGARAITRTKQSGTFGAVRFRPLEDLALLVGARVSDWSNATRNYNASGIHTTTTGEYRVNDEVTPYVGAVYRLSSVWSAYTSYTEIFRPQNYKDKDFELLSPVLGRNVEAGVKAEFFAGRFQVSAAVFETKQDNFAVRDASQPDNSLPDGSHAYLGVDGTTSRGVELELSGFIRRGWTIHLGYANTDTDRHPLDLTYANVPEHLIHLATHYQFPGRWNRLTLGASANWQGKATGVGILHPSGTVDVSQSAFALVNVFANYRFSDRLSAALSVRNTFDETYWATLDYPNYGEPRSAQLSLRWHY